MLITFMNAFPTPLGGGKNKAEGTDGVSVCATHALLHVAPCSPLLSPHLSSPSPLPNLLPTVRTYAKLSAPMLTYAHLY